VFDCCLERYCGKGGFRFRRAVLRSNLISDAQYTAAFQYLISHMVFVGSLHFKSAEGWQLSLIFSSIFKILGHQVGLIWSPIWPQVAHTKENQYDKISFPQEDKME